MTPQEAYDILSQVCNQATGKGFFPNLETTVKVSHALQTIKLLIPIEK